MNADHTWCCLVSSPDSRAYPSLTFTRQSWLRPEPTWYKHSCGFPSLAAATPLAPLLTPLNTHTPCIIHQAVITGLQRNTKSNLHAYFIILLMVITRRMHLTSRRVWVWSWSWHTLERKLPDSRTDGQNMTMMRQAHKYRAAYRQTHRHNSEQISHIGLII